MKFAFGPISVGHPMNGESAVTKVSTEASVTKKLHPERKLERRG